MMSRKKKKWSRPESQILLYILDRIEKNKNFLCAMLGPTGSGKSTASMRMSERLDPNFNIDRVVFTPQELLKLINEGDLESGACVVLDESGVMANTREWQSVSNKLLNYVFQTFRHRNLILFFNVPIFAFLDSHARALFHGLFVTKSIDHTNKQVILEPKFVQTNVSTGRQYFKYMRVPGRWGLEPIKIHRVGLPDKKLLEAYEIKKLEYTTRLYKHIWDKLNKKHELTALQQQAFDLRKGGASVEEIATAMRVQPREVYNKLLACKKKGFVVGGVGKGEKRID